MPKILILADDLTGALDTGIKFASQGLPISVLLDPETDFQNLSPDQSLVMCLPTRHLSKQNAYAAVSRFIHRAKQAQFDWIFKKTDSALRGNIGPELSAIADAYPGHNLHFFPSYPQMNRLTIGGIHYIDGTPVAESIFAKDPFSPVKHSNVAQLICSQWSAPIQTPTAPGIRIYDSRSKTDLAAQVLPLLDSDSPRLVAGCAGLAEALGAILPGKQNQAGNPLQMPLGLLVLCGSINPISRKQLQLAEDRNFSRYHIPVSSLLDPSEHPQLLRKIRALYAKNPFLILDALEDDDCVDEALRGPVSSSLGAIFAALVEEISCPIMVIGGDTLLACLSATECNQIHLKAELFPGTVLLEMQTPSFSHILISKSGGFGDPDLLIQLQTKL